jgi:orotate phosphoribosyltransferase
LAGRCILLVDDVMTTGSTAASCALALKRAGAARVALLTVARVDRRLNGTSGLPAHTSVGGARLK